MSNLVQIDLDFASVVRLGIRDAYDWHQRAWECFPGRDGKQRDFLTRLEQKDDHLRLLILSPDQPKRPDWCPADCWQGPKRIPEDYFSQRHYRFQLCANPTKKVKAFRSDGSERPNGRREPLHKREDLIAWLTRKGERAGFVPDEATLRTIPRGREYFRKDGKPGLHGAVEFQGMLTVTDTVKFREAFTRGIGSAKAFGFGMLVIASVA